MTFLYALLLCSGAGSTQQCLPPQYFYTEKACVGMANAYKVVGSNKYATRVSCVKLPIASVVM